MALLRAKPMRQRSEKAKARDKRLVTSKHEILTRCRGACEVCGARDVRLDHHHIFGRVALGRPMSDSAEAGAALCRPCHTYVTRHPLSPEQLGLEATAVARLENALYEAAGGSVDLPKPSTYRRAAVVIVEALEALWVEP